jgi:hypothetical protein
MLTASMLGDYSTSASSTPFYLLRRTDLLGNLFLITSLLDLLFSFSSFLDHHTGHPACRRFDLLEAHFPHVITRPLFVRQDFKQVGCQVDLFFFLLDRRACYSTCR